MSHTDHEERQVAAKTQEEIEDEHWSKVKDARGDLWECLRAAQKELQDAIAAHQRLSGGDAWDVEYEGSDTEFSRYLSETNRILTITRALMPTAADTSTNTDRQLTDTVRALMSGSHLK